MLWRRTPTPAPSTAVNCSLAPRLCAPYRSDMRAFILLTLALSAATYTLTCAKIFDAPRAWVLRKSAFVGALVDCPYCASHWLAALAVAVYRPRLGAHPSPWLDGAAAWLVLVWCAALATTVLALANRVTHHVTTPLPPAQNG